MVCGTNFAVIMMRRPCQPRWHPVKGDLSYERCRANEDDQHRHHATVEKRSRATWRRGRPPIVAGGLGAATTAGIGRFHEYPYAGADCSDRRTDRYQV